MLEICSIPNRGRELHKFKSWRLTAFPIKEGSSQDLSIFSKNSDIDKLESFVDLTMEYNKLEKLWDGIKVSVILTRISRLHLFDSILIAYYFCFV